jgi:hypothetical protein
MSIRFLKLILEHKKAYETATGTRALDFLLSMQWVSNYGFFVCCPIIVPGYKVSSIHTSEDPVQAVKEAEAFYVGGGNTFQLLKALYDWKLIDPIRKRVLEVIFMSNIYDMKFACIIILILIRCEFPADNV